LFDSIHHASDKLLGFQADERLKEGRLGFVPQLNHFAAFGAGLKMTRDLGRPGFGQFSVDPREYVVF
jgi:hypothetical protein